MTSRFLTATAVLAICAVTQASAQNLPGWTPQTICVEDATPEHCRFLEGQAKSQISQQWQFIPSLIRERCLTKSDEESSQSWRLFGECLATAARPPQNDGVQVAAVDGEATVSDADPEALSAELEAIRAQLAEAEASREADLAAAQERIAELESALEKATTQQKSAQARIEGLQQRLMAATDANAEADATDADASAAMAELQESLDSAITRAEAAEFRVNALEKSLSEAQASAKTADESDAARIAELEASLETAGTEVMRGEARIEGLQARLLEMVASADAAEGESDAQARVADLESELAKAQTEANRANARIEGLQARLVEMADAAAAESAGESEAEARITELESALKKAEAGSSLANARIAGLQERLMNALASEPQATTEENDAVAGLESRLAVAESRIENLTARLRKSRDAVRMLGQEKADLMAQQEGETSAAVTALENRLDIANSRLDNLATRLRNSRDAAKALEAEKARAETALANAKSRIMALQDSMIDTRRTTQEKIAALNAQVAEKADAEAGDAVENLQRLLDNQRERSERVAGIVSEQRARIREMETEMRSLRRVAQAAGARTCQDRMATVVAENGIQFDNNKSDIRPDAAATINRLIAVARGCEDAEIVVRGHTDSMGERSYNVYLSELRAAAVVEYMTSNGIAPSRVSFIGVGPDEPIADNRTRSGRAQNRRIEIIVR